ncbi:O-antigen ligase family protein [Candidatus Uhrbacteria bacterium]|nr:O-antigen ligase family protein [Candidatus Uhrbacteria bacterium]
MFLHRPLLWLQQQGRSTPADRLLAVAIAVILGVTVILGFSSTEVWAETLIYALVSTLLYLSIRLHRFPIPHTLPLGIPLLGLIVAALLSTATSVNLYPSMLLALRSVLVVGLTMLVASTVRCDRATVHIILFGILSGALIIVVLGYIGFFREQMITLAMQSNYGWKNIYAGLLLLVLPLQYWAMLNATRRWQRLALMIIAIMTASALILSFSQGAWLSIALVAPIFLVASLQQGRRRGFVDISAFIVGTVVVTASFIVIHNRVTPPTGESIPSASQIAPFSFINRVEYWQTAINVANTYPLLGTGLGNYEMIARRFQSRIGAYHVWPHNMILQAFAEMGIIGGTLFILFWGAVVWAVARECTRAMRERSNPKHSTLVLMLTGSILASGLHNLLDMDLNVMPLNLILFITIGMMIGLHKTEGHPIPAVQLSATRQAGISALTLILLLVLFQINIAEAHAVRATTQTHANGVTPASIAEALNAVRSNPLNPVYLNAVSAQVIASPTNADLLPLPTVIQLARRAVTLNPQQAEAHFRLGKIYQRAANAAQDAALLEQAITEMSIAIELDPHNNPYRYLELASIYRQQGQRDKTKELLAFVIVHYSESRIREVFGGVGVQNIFRSYANQAFAEYQTLQ